MCYTCVRECPAKAIRILDGQAEVMATRCIACGNCVRVCSQQSKRSLDNIPDVEALLAGGKAVAALLAPSFPAEFWECSAPNLVGALKQVGFQIVAEVSFGADLVADRYKKLLLEEGEERKSYIATTCPAVVGYVERYYPMLIPNLAPIVSPMVAAARVLRQKHGDDLPIVFIGPCIAKKVEACSEALPDEIAAAITFTELRQIFKSRNLDLETQAPAGFDPPYPGRGALFPISRGMLQAADISEDLMETDVVATSGRENFTDAVREFAMGHLDAHLLEVLCCHGCIMGPGMTTTSPVFHRQARVSRYVREHMRSLDEEGWRAEMAAYETLDLSRGFRRNDQRLSMPQRDLVDDILRRMGKYSSEDELNCGACGYDTCRDHAVAIYKGFAESEMCLPYTIEKLKKTINELAKSHTQLASAQEALMQSEKLASMGQLAAGIAHEVNNPLGIVLMYAHMLLEECDESSPMYAELKMVTQEADRCKKIVSGLLHFARRNKVLRQPIDVKELIERSVGVVAKPDDVTVSIDCPPEDRIIEADADQMIQVLTNLISNAYAAMPHGGALAISSWIRGGEVGIAVKDSGTGIPPENRKKIFEPFFTTKQMGKGTGLGLAVAYGIIKMHSGQIELQSNHDVNLGPTGTTFTIRFPRKEEYIETL